MARTKDQTVQQSTLDLPDPKRADNGIAVWACRVRADNDGLSETPEEAGINVFHVGQSATDMFKQGWNSLAF